MAILRQTTFIVSTLLSCWLAMQAVHELGHVVAAWCTGAHVERVVLYPLTLSRTDIGRNPHPLLVVWGGPLLGTVLPLIGWLVAARARWSGTFVLRFFAGFCCVANGMYIGVGSLFAIGDCGEMLRHGANQWQLWLFGVGVTPLGFYLWHRQAFHFGIGKNAQEISTRLVVRSFVVCLVLIALGFIVDGHESPLP